MLQSTFTLGDLIVVAGFLISVITIFVRFAKFQTRIEERMTNAENRLNAKDELDKRQDDDIAKFRDDTQRRLNDIAITLGRMDERDKTMFNKLQELTK